MDNSRPTSPPRVAVTLEQCWHPVPGGTATYALEVTRALAGRAEVVGVSAWHRHPAPDAWRPSVPVRALPLPRKALYAAWGAARRPRVQVATGAVDVVHAVTFAVPPRSAPLVVTVHDLAFRRDPTHFTRRGLAFFERGLAQTRAQADLVLCPSMTTLEDCERAGIAADRLRHTPLGVRVPEVGPEEVAGFRRRHGLERPYVLWTGTLEPRKNLPTLLEAFALLAQTPAGQDLDLVLVGPRGWGQVSVSGRGPRPERVRALGFLDVADLHAAYAGARAFCYPATWEGFGLPVLEAMAHGVPVVTSAGTSMAEFATGAGLLVPATDAAGFAAALEAAVGEDHDRLGAAARGAAARRTWDRTASLTSDAYVEVTG